MKDDFGKRWVEQTQAHIGGEFYALHFYSEGQEHWTVIHFKNNQIYSMRIEDDDVYAAVKAYLIAAGKIVEQEYVMQLREEQRKNTRL
jgi:hypothetical protein